MTVRGDDAAAERLLGAALVLEEEARATPSAARTRLWYARALLRGGRVEMARELATEAMVTAARLGMTKVHADAAALLSDMTPNVNGEPAPRPTLSG